MSSRENVAAVPTPAAPSSPLSRLQGDHFHAPKHVSSTSAPDAVMLMDRTRGTYYTLNEVGGRIWSLLCEGNQPVVIVDQLTTEYAASREQLEGDVAAVIEQLLAAGLLVVGGEPAPSNHATPASSDAAVQSSPGENAKSSQRAFRMPSLLGSALTIAWVKLQLATRGYEGTLQRIRRRSALVPATEWAGIDAVRAAEYNVALAAALFPARAHCLERSLALYSILRRQGIAARYYQGTQPYPFQAHAWIEYRGEVVNDVAEHVEMYARLPEQLP